MTRRERYFLGFAIAWGLLALGVAAFLLLATVTTAGAMDFDDPWVERQIVQQCYDNRRCWQGLRRGRRQPAHGYYRHRSHGATRVYSYVERDRDHDDRWEGRGSECRDPMMIVGEERYGRDRAKEAADAIWMERVRFRWGVRYMDLKNARGVSYECVRSSTGNRASEKAQEVAGRFLEQCEVRARPCLADRERVDKESKR